MKMTIRNNTVLALLLIHSFAYAAGVTINGKPLSSAEISALEMQIGQQIAPGNYLSDGNCWVNLSTGTSGCLNQGTVNTYSRYGSGEYNSAGDWNYWSNAAGGSVGGTSDGCVYTSYGWSNC
jgi:hypothetical protein